MSPFSIDYNLGSGVGIVACLYALLQFENNRAGGIDKFYSPFAGCGVSTRWLAVRTKQHLGALECLEFGMGNSG